MPDKEREDRHEEREEAIARRWPWLLPLAAGIFLGAALFEMMPEALDHVGLVAWLACGLGVLLFIAVRDGLDALGRQGLAWVATLGIWIHSFLEGAVTASSYSVNLVTGLLVSAGLILHLIPEVAAVIALLTAAGLSYQQSLLRNGITWAMIVVGFLVVFFLFPNLPEPVLGSALAVGAGGFLYLAYASWKEHKWQLWPSIGVAAAGVALMGVLRLIEG